MPASSFVRGSGLAALAVALPFVAPAVAASASSATEPEPEPASYCSTRELTPAQLAAGETNEIACYPTLEESLRAVGLWAPEGATPDTLVTTQSSTAGVAAVHYKGNQGTGEALTVAGDGCNGGGLSFRAGESWNDSIASTRHRMCTTIKHYSDADYQGVLQVTSGSNGTMWQLNGALGRQVSSIRYYGPVNY